MPRSGSRKPEIEAAIAAGVSQIEAARILAVSRTWLQEGRRNDELLDGRDFDPAKWEDAEAALDPTNERKRMSAACDRFRIGVLEGDLSHDGNAVLARHVGHCVTKDTPYGAIVHKDAPDSPRKIDAAVAAIVAYDRAAWHATNSRSWEPMIAFVPR